MSARWEPSTEPWIMEHRAEDGERVVQIRPRWPGGWLLALRNAAEEDEEVRIYEDLEEAMDDGKELLR